MKQVGKGEPLVRPGQRALVWMRRDLRCTDHAALYYALRHFQQVYCVFVFDTDILDALSNSADRRVAFIHASVVALNQKLRALAAQAGVQGAGLIVRHGAASHCIVELAAQLRVQAVLTNRDYEPAAIARDRAVASALQAKSIEFYDFKDQVLLDRDEVLNLHGSPYSVFTPYKRTWLQKLDHFQRKPYPIQPYAKNLVAVTQPVCIPSLKDIGFAQAQWSAETFPAGEDGAQRLLGQFAPRLNEYAQQRDFPSIPATSHLSVHLRFGTVSIRQLATMAWDGAARGSEGAQTWLSELAWRDFYFMILWHHPEVVEQCFRPEYDHVQWDDEPVLFQAWCEARTGFPLVDAAMRQLLTTGYMHNRLRMVVASFLTKDLGVDWRHGERFFAEHLLDYDLAANNGGWQWAASTGCDAQPWFRIFNPVTQSQRFDPDGSFIRHYLPELARVPTKHIHFPAALKPHMLQACGVVLGKNYPEPIVDHGRARERTLMRFHFLSKNTEK